MVLQPIKTGSLPFYNLYQNNTMCGLDLATFAFQVYLALVQSVRFGFAKQSFCLKYADCSGAILRLY